MTMISIEGLVVRLEKDGRLVHFSAFDPAAPDYCRCFGTNLAWGRMYHPDPRSQCWLVEDYQGELIRNPSGGGRNRFRFLTRAEAIAAWARHHKATFNPGAAA